MEIFINLTKIIHLLFWQLVIKLLSKTFIILIKVIGELLFFYNLISFCRTLIKLQIAFKRFESHRLLIEDTH